MGICEICDQEMTTANGCTLGFIRISGLDYLRIPAPLYISQCHDCNALPGHLHHPGCDSEICPACAGQAISCDCGRS